MRSTKFRVTAWLVLLLLVLAQFVLTGSGIAPSAYGLLMQAGVPLARRSTLNMDGVGVTCVDNPGSTRTDCTVPGVSASGVSLYSATASATNAAAAEATLIGAGSGGLNLPANYFSPAGVTLVISAAGHYSTPIDPGTLRIRLKVGAATVLDTGAWTPLPSVTNAVWTLDARIVSRTVGAGGTVMAQSEFRPGVGVPIGQDWPMLNTAAVALDTTAVNTVNLTAEWSAATGETITGTNFLMSGVTAGSGIWSNPKLMATFLLCAGPCTVGETSNWKWTAPFALTVQSCTIDAMTYPTGADMTVDILRQGTTTIFSGAVMTLPAGGVTFQTNSGMAAAASLTAGQFLTASVTGIGSTIPGQFVNVVCTTAY